MFLSCKRRKVKEVQNLALQDSFFSHFTLVAFNNKVRDFFLYWPVKFKIRTDKSKLNNIASVPKALFVSDYGPRCFTWRPPALGQWSGSRWARTWCRSTSRVWGMTLSWCSTSPPTTARWTRSLTCGWFSQVSLSSQNAYSAGSCFMAKLNQCVAGTRIGQASECFVYWKDPSTSDTWGLNFTSPIDAKQFRECCVSC